jgi:hypothetical protein
MAARRQLGNGCRCNELTALAPVIDVTRCDDDDHETEPTSDPHYNNNIESGTSH